MPPLNQSDADLGRCLRPAAEKQIHATTPAIGISIWCGIAFDEIETPSNIMPVPGFDPRIVAGMTPASAV